MSPGKTRRKKQRPAARPVARSSRATRSKSKAKPRASRHRLRVGITCYPTFGGSGIVAMGMGKKNSAIIAAFPVEESDDLMLISDQGQIIRVAVSGISIQGRSAQGVTVFRVDEGERVVSVERIEEVSEEAAD